MEIHVDGQGVLPPGELRSLVSGVIRRATLLPTATIDTTRRAIELEDRRDRSGAVEVSDDATSSTVQGDPRAVFRQVEVEAVGSPSRAMLVDVAERLTDAGATPTDSTKLQLALGTPPDPEVRISKIKRKSSVAALTRFAIASGTARLIAHDPVVRLGSDPEGIHQARVATRRMRSDLKTLEPLLTPAAVARLRTDLAWLGGLLGAVRDLDVLTDRIEDRADGSPRVEDEASAAIVSMLRDDRRIRWLELVDAMGSARYVDLLEALVTASQEPPVIDGWSHRRAKPVLRKLVRKTWRRTARAVSALDAEPSDAALHEVRKRAKRARYSAELGRGLFGKPARRLAKGLEAIQDVLGELQDGVVAEETLGSLPGRELSSPAAYLAGAIVCEERGARASIRDRWPAVWRSASRKRRRRWLR
jgi:CHAD domain-containing protein